MTNWGKSRSLLKVSKTDFHENKIIPRKCGMTCDKSILTLLCFLIYFCSSYSSSSSHGNRWPKSALTLTFSKVVNSNFALLWAVSVYDKRLLCVLSIQNPENELWTWITTKFPIIVVVFSLEKFLSHGQKIHVLHYTSSSNAQNALNYLTN